MYKEQVEKDSKKKKLTVKKNNGHFYLEKGIKWQGELLTSSASSHLSQLMSMASCGCSG